MLLKRYIVNDLAEAVKQIKNDLGPQAMVLAAREVQRSHGPLGLFREPALEVTAVRRDADEAGAADDENAQAGRPTAQPARLGRQLDALRRRQADLLPMARAARLGIDVRMLPLHDRLRGQDLASDLLCDLLRALGPAADEAGLRDQLARRCTTSPPPAPPEEGQRVVVLVGPRGAGKSALVTKWAASIAREVGPRLALISADTRRRMAASQTQRLGALLQVPTALVLEAGSLAAALDAVKRPGSLVLVDAPGADAGEVTGTLGPLFRSRRPDQVRLVLDASWTTADLLHTAEAYSAVGPDAVDFTHLDTTTAFGGLPSVLLGQDLPAGWLAAGPVLPDDLLAATPARLAALPFEFDEERATASARETA